MIATIDGHLVEGTPEEIAKLLGITIKDTDTTVIISDSFDSIPEACKRCSNYGKGPCMCTIPYMTRTGWDYRISCWDYQISC